MVGITEPGDGVELVCIEHPDSEKSLDEEVDINSDALEEIEFDDDEEDDEAAEPSRKAKKGLNLAPIEKALDRIYKLGHAYGDRCHKPVIEAIFVVDYEDDGMASTIWAVPYNYHITRTLRRITKYINANDVVIIILRTDYHENGKAVETWKISELECDVPIAKPKLEMLKPEGVPWGSVTFIGN